MQGGSYRAIFRDVADEERRELEERERYHDARKEGVGVVRESFRTFRLSWQAAVGKLKKMLISDEVVYTGNSALKVREMAASWPTTRCPATLLNDAAVIFRNGRWVAFRRLRSGFKAPGRSFTDKHNLAIGLRGVLPALLVRHCSHGKQILFLEEVWILNKFQMHYYVFRFSLGSEQHPLGVTSTLVVGPAPTKPFFPRAPK